MTIEIKNLQYTANSQAKINHWTADVFVDGQQAFSIRQGPKYMQETIAPEKRELYQQAEKWCHDNLPVSEGTLVNNDGSETKFPVHTSLYAHVQDLAGKEVDRQAQAKYDRQMGEAMKTKFIIGKPGSSKSMAVDFGEPIRDYLATEGNKKVLKEFVAAYVVPQLTGNRKLLNTNFAKATLEDLGIPGHLIHSEEKLVPRKLPPGQRRASKTPRKGLT